MMDKKLLNKKFLETKKSLDGTLRERVSMFDLWEYLNSTKPQQRGTYALLSISGFAYILISIFIVEYSALEKYSGIFFSMFVTSSLTAILFSVYKFWSEIFYESELLGLLWFIGSWYIWSYAPCVLVLLGNIGIQEISIYIFSIAIITQLMDGKRIILFITSGPIFAFLAVTYYAKGRGIELDLYVSKLYLICFIVFFAEMVGVFILFQENQQMKLRLKVKHIEKEIKCLRGCMKANLRDLFLKNFQKRNIEILETIDMLLHRDKIIKLAEKDLTGLEIAVSGTERLRTYFDNLLILNQIRNSILISQKKIVNLKELIEKVIQKLKSQLIDNEHIWRACKYENVNFNIHVKRHNVMVSVDERLMSRAIENIIENAIIYSKEGDITVVVGEVISVIDSGVGIPEDEIDKIFEPFYVSTRTKALEESRGLGLPVAKSIIELHGGIIYAKNNQSNGATVSFTIPC